MFYLQFNLIVVLCLITLCLSYDEDTLIESNVGSIVGAKAKDGEYYMYLGIPYAKVNMKNVFGPAVPHPPFEDVYEATDDSVVCPQINQDNDLTIGRLDCLRLNIYVPSSIFAPNMIAPSIPVMVWIYGGGFQYGHAKRNVYGPNYFIAHDVILVTFNYRIGPYGFMCLDVPEVPGNQGLRDQYLAFKWIKNNIQAFGGNPKQITLFGGGAGAHSIDLHLISDKDIMFNKIILQSGSSLAVPVLYKPDKKAAVKIAKRLGYNTSHTGKAIVYLNKVNPEQVINAANKIKIKFKPCVESNFEEVEPFLPASWINSKVPNIKDMPVMMGFNKYEMARSILTKNHVYFKNETIISKCLSRVFDYASDELPEVVDIVSRYYISDQDMAVKLKWAIIRFSSDFFYIYPMHRTLKRYLESEAGNIYFYMFSYVGGQNAIITTNYDNDKNFNNICCASHADELGYLFTNRNHQEFSNYDQTVMERMTKMWTNFAKHSDPTPEASDILPVKWLPVTPSTYHFLNINNELTPKTRPLHDRMAFWDLFYKYNYKLQRGYEKDLLLN